jgi:hypothetical protein
MATASDGIADRAFVTWLAKITQDAEFAALLPWWRRQCLERALDVIGREGSEYEHGANATLQRMAAQLAGVAGLVLAMQNEVASKGELIDGRTTRHAAGAPAAGKQSRGRKQ